jgi:hypothetical protein
MGVGGQRHAPAAFSPRKDPVPIVQEAGRAPGPVWIGAENPPPLGFDPQVIQSIASRYTDWAIPAPVHKQNLKGCFLRGTVQLHDDHYRPYTLPHNELKSYSSLINTELLLSSISEYYTGRQLGHKLVWFTNLNSEQEK